MVKQSEKEETGEEGTIFGVTLSLQGGVADELLSIRRAVEEKTHRKASLSSVVRGLVHTKYVESEAKTDKLLDINRSGFQPIDISGATNDFNYSGRLHFNRPTTQR